MGVDWIQTPMLGTFLRWKHARTALQFPLFLLALLMIVHGLWGPQSSPKNLATVITWIHYRGMVILALLLAGNLFCLACPFMGMRNLVRRFVRPTRMWPRRLRNKWGAAGLFALFLFAYEYFDLWATPFWTSWLIIGYFLLALLVDSLFVGASFCKYVCPIGQFNFVTSLISPLEIKVRNPDVCVHCATKECIRGHTEQRGCELWLFQPRKFGNMDCTFCLDCVHACPYENVGVGSRLPGSELWQDPWRSGVGRLSQRPDLALLVVFFTFGALLNAFGMVSPVYVLERWLEGRLHVSSEWPVLSLIFTIGLVVEPALLLLGATWATYRWGGLRQSPARLLTQYTFTLVPIGVGVWAAHYAFHFFTGFWAFVPIVRHLIGPSHSPGNGMVSPLVPPQALFPFELGLLGLGWVGSILVAYRLASKDAPRRIWPVLLPWALVATLILAAAVWLLMQPMEMRAMSMPS